MRAFRSGIAIYLIFTSVAAAQCEGHRHADQVAAPPQAPSARLEYALGQPKSVDVDDAGTIRQVSYVKAGSHAIFEGDIIIGDANQIEFAAAMGPVKLQRRAAAGPGDLTPFGYVARSVLSGAQKWTNNVIPYTIDPNLNSGDVILRSMQAWSSLTKLRFVERTAANSAQYPNFVYFTIGSDPRACLSEGIGMSSGRQNVELVSGCEYGQIVHEIGHVIGLHHEQNRADRDSYVHVETANIIQGYSGQFAPRPAEYKDIGAYDFDSIMHYEPGAFSCNGQPTIVPNRSLPPGVQMGQRNHISAEDADVVNSIYK